MLNEMPCFLIEYSLLLLLISHTIVLLKGHEFYEDFPVTTNYLDNCFKFNQVQSYPLNKQKKKKSSCWKTIMYRKLKEQNEIYEIEYVD